MSLRSPGGRDLQNKLSYWKKTWWSRITLHYYSLLSGYCVTLIFRFLHHVLVVSVDIMINCPTKLLDQKTT